MITDSPKLCECGCGQPTELVKVTRYNRNQIKGQPRPFLPGHQMRRPQQNTGTERTCLRCGKHFHISASKLAEGRGKGTYCSLACRRPNPPKGAKPVALPPATGFCLCGCGGRAPIAKQTSARYGYVKGQPMRYIHNHNRQQARPDLRFWSNVDTSGGPDACWPWMGTRSKTGYGQIGIDGRHELAHRYSFMIHHGPLGPDEQTLHKCDFPPCCNPRHLFKGTAKANMMDKVAKGRQPVGSQLHNSKLTDDQVREIRARYAAGGISQAKLAAEYGVTQHPIWAIVNRKQWKHVT